jgi:hypothetical protein
MKQSVKGSLRGMVSKFTQSSAELRRCPDWLSPRSLRPFGAPTHQDQVLRRLVSEAGKMGNAGIDPHARVMLQRKATRAQFLK